MKKFLSILTVCLAFTSCTPDRVLIEELINNGTEESPLFYHNGEPFTGIAFKVFPNSREIMKPEFTIKDGKPDGYYETHLPNGFEIRSNWKNGKLDGVYEKWDERLRLREKSNYKNGVLDGKTVIIQESGGRWTGQYKNGKEDGKWRFFDENNIGGPVDEYKEGELISSYGWGDPEGSGEVDEYTSMKNEISELQNEINSERAAGNDVEMLEATLELMEAAEQYLEQNYSGQNR